MNVRLVYMSADHKGMITLGKAPCKFYAQPVGFFRSDLAGAEGLAHMIGNHIIRATHSSGSGNVLPLCQKKLCIRSPAVTRITGNEFAVICLNILAVKNHDSGNMETGIPEWKTSLIGLFIIDKKLSECQAQSRFAGRKPALHL